MFGGVGPGSCRALRPARNETRTARRSAVEFGGDTSPPAPQENKILVGWLGNKTYTPFSSVWVLSAPPCKIDLPFLRPLRRAHHPLGQFTRVLLLVLCRCAVPAFLSFGALLATPKRRLSSSSRQTAGKTSPPDSRYLVQGCIEYTKKNGFGPFSQCLRIVSVKFFIYFCKRKETTF